MTKEEEIRKHMDILKISRKEAEELYKFDHENLVTPEMEKMERDSKKIRRYEKSEKTRKKTIRERKIDVDKAFLLISLSKGIKDNVPTVVETRNESEISFKYNDNNYTVKLIKHRLPKNQAVFFKLSDNSLLGGAFAIQTPRFIYFYM